MSKVPHFEALGIPVRLQPPWSGNAPAWSARSRVLLSTMLSRVDSKIRFIRNGELLYK